MHAAMFHADGCSPGWESLAASGVLGKEDSMSGLESMPHLPIARTWMTRPAFWHWLVTASIIRITFALR